MTQNKKLIEHKSLYTLDRLIDKQINELRKGMKNGTIPFKESIKIMSELVAAKYKMTELMDGDRTATSYLKGRAPEEIEEIIAEAMKSIGIKPEGTR